MKFLFLLVLLSSFLYAKDFGIIQHTFPIVEENLITVLKKRLLSIQDNPLVSKKAVLKEMVTNPKGFILPNAKKFHIFMYDPTYTIEKDIKTHDGKLLYKKGFQFNPLKNIDHLGGLLIFDGANLAHIHWALKQSSSFKWIITNGKPLSLEKKYQKPVYFDQNSAIIHQLSITALPARITKCGLLLKIEQVVIEGEG